MLEKQKEVPFGNFMIIADLIEDFMLIGLDRKDPIKKT